jgi:hypothetical protein
LRQPVRARADGRRKLMKRLLALAPAAVIVVTMTARGSPPSIGPIRELPNPASSPSAQPQLAVTSEGRVILSWLEQVGAGTGRAFRYAFKSGDSWTTSATIVERDTFFVNWADVPSIYPLPGGRLAAHWLQYNGPGTYAYDVRLSFSDVRGEKWSPDVAPHRDSTKTEHGFASFFDWPGGGTGVVWLDGRQMADGHGDDRGAMTLRTAHVAADGTIGEDAVIDARVCECCPTTAATTSRGAIVAYRDRSEKEVRDIAVVRFEDGAWSAPSRVHADDWQINACPVNGPALAASGDRVALAWFTAEGDRPRVLVAFSEDAGRTWGPPVRVDEARSLGRVDTVMLDDGSAVVMWMEHLDAGSELRARVVQPGGTRGPFITVSTMTADRQSGYARMVRVRDELVFAWVSTRPSLHVKTGVAALR